MSVTVNGEARHLAEGATLADVVRELRPDVRGVAAAVNDEVVPRGGWDERVLVAGDRVEILTAAQGG